MTNLFLRVKASVTTRQAAEAYGLSVASNGMTCCPFHNDHHPSMKVDTRYYCFACHETGDVIDFTAKLFKLRPYEAAKSWQQTLALIPMHLLLCRPQHFHAARKQNVNLLNVVFLYWWIMNSFCDTGRKNMRLRLRTHPFIRALSKRLRSFRPLGISLIACTSLTCANKLQKHSYRARH